MENLTKLLTKQYVRPGELFIEDKRKLVVGKNLTLDQVDLYSYDLNPRIVCLVQKVFALNSKYLGNAGLGEQTKLQNIEGMQPDGKNNFIYSRSPHQNVLTCSLGYQLWELLESPEDFDIVHFFGTIYDTLGFHLSHLEESYGEFPVSFLENPANEALIALDRLLKQVPKRD